MGNIITRIGDAFQKMKTAILNFLVNLGIGIMNIIIRILDVFWSNTRSYLVKCKEKIEHCRRVERKAITDAMLESAAVMNSDLKQRLQNSVEISPETKTAIGRCVDEYAENMKDIASAA